jgi:hypothetical protein
MVVLLPLLWSCTEPVPVETAQSNVQQQTSTTMDDTEYEVMDGPRLLSRISLDLRGVRPDASDLMAIREDSSLIDAFVQTYLDDPLFEQRVVDLYASIYLTRQDTFSVAPSDYYNLSNESAPDFAKAVGEEPLRILAHIASNDLPYTELLTGDWTMATPQLAEAWGLERESDEAGWARAYYTDSRPAAGVLATNGMWWRYGSNTANANRGRANAVSRIFTCNDYLKKSIAFERDINLLDEGAVNDALKTNPGCVACHISLDPIASYFWGYLYFDTSSALEVSSYHPERELLWETYTQVEPGWFGTRGSNLTDLGQQITSDNAFVECAVEQATSLLLQREPDLYETDDFNTHRAAFIESGLLLKELLRSIVNSDVYRAAPVEGDVLNVGWKFVSLEQYAQSITALTGFHFSYEGYDMMSTDTYGLRTIAGGIDGLYVSKQAREPTSTSLLVFERFTQAAASYLVEQEFLMAEESRHVFTEIRLTETFENDPDAMVAQVQRLHLLLFGTDVAKDGPEVVANRDLWEQLYLAEGTTQAAWADLTSVLMRDPMSLFY